MSKSDVSGSSKNRLAKDASENTIEFQLEDELSDNSDAVIKVKKVRKFLGLDPTKYKIIGDHEIKSHQGNVSHIKGTFTIRDKKTKKVEQLVVDFVKRSNEKEYTGVVTSVVSDSTDSQINGLATVALGNKVIVSKILAKGELQCIEGGINCIPPVSNILWRLVN